MDNPFYKSKFERTLPDVGGASAVVTIKDSDWNEREQVAEVTGTIAYYGVAGNYLAFKITAPDEVTDISKASYAIGVHTPRPIAASDVATDNEREVIIYVKIERPTESVKIRVDWDGWDPDTCGVFWVSAKDVILQEEPETPADINSIYGLSKQVFGTLTAGVEFRIAATLSTLVQGTKALENTQFKYTITPPTPNAVIKLSQDGTDMDTPEGLWPSKPVTIPAQYDSTTNFYVTTDTPGEYVLNVALIDATSEEEYLSVKSTYTIR